MTERPRTAQRSLLTGTRETADDLLAKVGLAANRDTYARYLSGGESQRVAIAGALTMSSAIVRFDEATSAIGSGLAGEVLSAIHNLTKEGKTMIVVSHEIAFVRKVARAPTCMVAGVTVEHGGVEEIPEHAANPPRVSHQPHFRR